MLWRTSKSYNLSKIVLEYSFVNAVVCWNF